MLIERLVWPHGKVCAAMLSVNLDAEFSAAFTIPMLMWIPVIFSALGEPV